MRGNLQPVLNETSHSCAYGGCPKNNGRELGVLSGGGWRIMRGFTYVPITGLVHVYLCRDSWRC